MRGMGNLTRAAYANQRMTLCLKLRQSNNEEAEYDDRATWAIHVACFHHSCFFKGVWRCLRQDVVIGNTPLFFSAQGIVASKMRKQEGCRYERRRSVQKEGC